MKGYDYWKNDWPRIVRDCFYHGGRMFVVVKRRDGSGCVEYEQGRELSEPEALKFRGMTIAVYGIGE